MLGHCGAAGVRTWNGSGVRRRRQRDRAGGHHNRAPDSHPTVYSPTESLWIPAACRQACMPSIEWVAAAEITHFVALIVPHKVDCGAGRRGEQRRGTCRSQAHETHQRAGSPDRHKAPGVCGGHTLPRQGTRCSGPPAALQRWHAYGWDQSRSQAGKEACPRRCAAARTCCRALCRHGEWHTGGHRGRPPPA